MKVLLNADVSKVGYKGEVVSVKDGYYRNFLFPKKLATLATKQLLALVEKRQEKVVIEKERLLDNVQDVLKKLKGLKIELSEKVAAKGTLYAAISAKAVVEAVKTATNVALEESYVKFEETIKTLGEHKITLEFGEGNVAKITLNVVQA